jgi:hypothetical protein
MKFVLVNGRIPRPPSFCTLCGKPIAESYLRDIATRLSYCDHKCYIEHYRLDRDRGNATRQATAKAAGNVVVHIGGPLC